MRAAVVPGPGSELVVEERRRPTPRNGEVLIRVRACGVCHGDLDLQQGAFPYRDIARYPVVPGHEVAGVVEGVGDGVAWPKVGMRVGLPWLYSSCGHCSACLSGDGAMCPEAQITGVTRDGGYQEYMIAPAAHVSLLPDELDFAEAAPLMCAGLTVFTGLRNAGFQPGDRVAIIGLGGLGHLGVLYARAMGGRAAVISRSSEKEGEAYELGAELFIDAGKTSVGETLQGWDGGANIILATAPAVDAVNAAVPGLARRGALVVIGLSESAITAKPIDLILGARKVVGSLIGSRKDIEDCLRLAVSQAIRPRIEKFSLADAGKALEKMKGGGLRGRAVVVME